MAARVTSAEVLEIFDTPTSITDLDVFILPATALVDEILGDSGLPAALLKEIERYLAAHFASMRYRQKTQEEIDDAKERLTSKVDMGLNASRYGQQALALDTTGKLNQATKPGRHTPSIEALAQYTDWV